MPSHCFLTIFAPAAAPYWPLLLVENYLTEDPTIVSGLALRWGIHRKE
ncbi:hypothetical protein [Neolewinella agarilytica]|nr:hypothetical protein [Neolewinella agarilytica]